MNWTHFSRLAGDQIPILTLRTWRTGTGTERVETSDNASVGNDERRLGTVFFQAQELLQMVKPEH